MASTKKADPEFMLAEIVGDALAETVKSVRQLVDEKCLELDVRRKELEAEFAAFRSEQIGQTKALWNRAGEVQASAAEQLEQARRELNVQESLNALERALLADKALAAETSAAFGKALSDLNATMRSTVVLPQLDFAAALQEHERRIDDKLEAFRAELHAELDPAAWIGQLTAALQALPVPLVQPNFQVPEVPVEMKVMVPPPRLVEKRHEYDQYNRPVRTIEIEIKADGE